MTLVENLPATLQFNEYKKEFGDGVKKYQSVL